MWKPISGYETTYEVSDGGLVRSLGGRRGTHGKVLKGFNYKGYRKVDLCINSKKRTFQVHRLVAEAFIPNPDNLPKVNHIDGVKHNNAVSNLEWCTHTENMHHAWRTGLMAKVGSNEAYL